MIPRRTIGKRAPRPVGKLQPPTAEQRAWMRQMARKRTCVPKGVFRYHTMEEANADWERWHAAALVEEPNLS